MTILSDINSISAPKAKALTIIRTINDGHAALLAAVRAGVDMVWDAEDPNAVAAELGTQAAKVFEASYAACVCLESVEPGCTDAILSKRGTYTVNEDGTVTNLVKPV